MRLTAVQRSVLGRMQAGWTLKAHRDLEGGKHCRLHPLAGEPEAVELAVVDALAADGLIDSNKKFPAATFWLTPLGRAALEREP